MNKYYAEFLTWREGMVEMPGQHTVIKETADYRLRSNLEIKINSSQVQNVFLSFNEDAVRKFLADNICACHVALLLEAADEKQAIEQITNNLGPIQLIGITLVTPENLPDIEKILGDIKSPKIS
jgi:hypothetical protein